MGVLDSFTLSVKTRLIEQMSAIAISKMARDAGRECERYTTRKFNIIDSNI